MLHTIQSFIHMIFLPQPECEVYCREKRIERYRQYGGQIRYLRLHSVVHYILIPIMRAILYLSGHRITVLRDDRTTTKRPLIFCPTHIGGVDIEMSFLAIRRPCWILMGDPRELYKDVSGMMLQMNGWIPMDIPDKMDRIAAKAKMQALLEAGGNLLLFPEGVWNISPNTLVGYLYAGAVELAITCNAEIVPMALHRDRDRYFVILGKNISYENCTYDERFRLTDELRDNMATLEWEMLEKQTVIRRSDISETAYDDMVNEIFDLNANYTFTLEDIRLEQFQPKSITEPDEAFGFFKKLKPNMNTAFLYRGNERFWDKNN